MTLQPLAGVLSSLAKRGVTQPVASPVPADDASFLAVKGRRKVAGRVLRQQLGLALSGQAALQVQHIAAKWRRAVWFHGEAPPLGDTLMDLAPRSLLAERGITLDMVVPPAAAAWLQGDCWLNRVVDDARSIDLASCDFAIVDRSTWRALAVKRSVAPRLPWLSVRGDYLAYDYHRALFATRRIAAWLGVSPSESNEAWHARQKLGTPASPTLRNMAATGSPETIAIALGGMQPERRYGAWAEVAARLAGRGALRFVLLGSENGLGDASRVKARLAGQAVVDLVGRTNLNAARQAIAESSCLLCADGGLMHLGCTTGTPILALFDSSVNPAWRLPSAAAGFRGAALRAERRDVSTITPEAVVEHALALLRSSVV